MKNCDKIRCIDVSNFKYSVRIYLQISYYSYFYSSYFSFYSYNSFLLLLLLLPQVSMMFAEAVRRTHNGESVSYLFSNVPY